MLTYPLQQQKHKHKGSLKSYQSYMCTYTIQQYKHKHKGSLTKWSVLNVYTPSTKTQTWAQSLFYKIPSIACVNKLKIK